MEGDIHTIVIGSGISGAAAANSLAEQGFKVLVLQANNYIGGRTKTINVTLSNNTVLNFDEGASWIHGSCNQNPITRLANKMTGVVMKETEDDSVTVFDEQGEDANKFVDKQQKIYEKLMQKSDKFENKSLYEAFAELDEDRLSDKYFMYTVSNDVEFQTASSITDLSAEQGQNDQQFQGSNAKQMLILSGYQAFPMFLMNHPNIRVLLNHEVRDIQYQNGQSMVRCTNGQNFGAENIVVSVPIGVLKTKKMSFTPALPNWKKEAIDKIHFGNVCKVLIIPKKNFIKEKEHYIGVVADNVDQRGLATYYLNLHGVAKVPALMTFGLGANADDLEQMGKEEMKNLICGRMKAFTENDVSPNDFDLMKTTWRENPNFGGTYSYAGVETKPKHWQNMAKPIFQNAWYFCGEHTHSRYRGTVHGAYLSGMSAADSIIKNVNEGGWKYFGKENDGSSSSSSSNE